MCGGGLLSDSDGAGQNPKPKYAIVGVKKGSKIFPGAFAPRTPHFYTFLGCFLVISKCPRTLKIPRGGIFFDIFVGFLCTHAKNIQIFSLFFFNYFFVHFFGRRNLPITLGTERVVQQKGCFRTAGSTGKKVSKDDFA